MHAAGTTESGADAAAVQVIEARGLGMAYGPRTVLKDIHLTVQRGEVLAIVGGSGSGKTTLMRLLALLQPPSCGSLSLFGQEVTHMDEQGINRLRRRIGVMFQQGALFGDQTVLENVSVPLTEHTDLSAPLIRQVALLKVLLAGLQPDAAGLYPNQLSGGMRKRASVARAIALDPEILFLDEPSSGLDPISADAMDELVLDMKRALGLTVVLVTHDMNSLWRVADRILLLADKTIAAVGTVETLKASSDPVVKQFFQSSRGRAAESQHG